MTTQTLTNGLRELVPGEYEWKFALYCASKSKDGIELDWHLCKMKGTSDWVDTIRTNLLERTTAEKMVAEYSPFLSDKESIAALGKDDDLVKEQIRDILINIKNGVSYAPEDFVSGVLPKVSGFAYYGEKKDEEGNVHQVIFMKRGNPFMAGQKVRLCTSNGNEIITSEKPILKFTSAVDFLYIGEVCYFNSMAICKDFDIEDRHFAIAAKRMTLIGEAEIVSDYERFEETVMSAKNARKFTGFDKDILDKITRMGVVDREEFLLTYGITLANNGLMDTSDPEQCELIIDLLCGRSVVDPLGRLAVGNNITPRE